MVSKAVKIRLGVFLVIGTALILLFVALVVGNKLIERRDVYYIEFENSSIAGLQVGGAVNYQGIKVGRVDNVRINPKDVTKIIVEISIEAGTPIKSDTEAVLIFVGITGVKAIELRGGTNQALTLKPKAYIKRGATALDDFSGRAISIADKIDEIASNLSKLTDEENRNNIAAILRQSSLLIQDTRANLTTTINSINKISGDIAQVTGEFAGQMSGMGANLSKNMDKLTDSTTRNIDLISSHATGSLDSLTLTTRNSIVQLTNSLDTDMNTLIDNLNTTILEVNNQTQALLKDTRFQINNVGTNSDAMILETTKQITAISNNINQSLVTINALLASPGFENVIKNVGELAGKLSETDMKLLVSELSTTVTKAGSLISNLDRTLLRSRSNLYEMIESLREASENLNDFSKQISDTPSILWRSN